MTEITGTIINQQLCSREPWEGQSRYSPNCIDSENYLAITLEDDEGMRYYFNTPAAKKSIVTGGSVAVVLFTVENGAAQWMKEAGIDGKHGTSVASPGKSNTNKIVALTDEGDEVTVTGRLTIKTSKYGNEYGRLTHVKRVA